MPKIPKKTFAQGLLAALVIALLSSSPAQAIPVTIATFADPAENGSTPLFMVDRDADLITGGWDNTGLDLNVFGDIYEDAIFTVSDVTITDNGNPWYGYETMGGTIRFFENKTNPDPLVQIDFDSAWITFFGFGGSDSFGANGITITGSLITEPLEGEVFSFSFANQAPLNGDWGNGYTATAAFMLSAIVVPEPATIALLGLGGIALLRKRKK